MVFKGCAALFSPRQRPDWKYFVHAVCQKTMRYRKFILAGDIGQGAA